ncbi:hypothetical protein ZEAMMB73_Zm00001d050147 [Zea mays]|uniref:Remorin C-terminal domain-containing protein n=1 Tax=Zea mays TaxID=4577 RepID=K7U3A1_MAIZE|nr:hypothetical protein ZEAMMB73_Zm00001d050147 [Zea mays]
MSGAACSPAMVDEEELTVVEVTVVVEYESMESRASTLWQALFHWAMWRALLGHGKQPSRIFLLPRGRRLLLRRLLVLLGVDCAEILSWSAASTAESCCIAGILYLLMEDYSIQIYNLFDDAEISEKFGGRWICLRIKSHTSWTPPSNPRMRRLRAELLNLQTELERKRAKALEEYNQDMTRINKIARGARSMAEVIQVMSLKVLKGKPIQ